MWEKRLLVEKITTLQIQKSILAFTHTKNKIQQSVIVFTFNAGRWSKINQCAFSSQK